MYKKYLADKTGQYTHAHTNTRTHRYIDLHMLLVNICAIKIRIETWPKQCSVIRMQMEVGEVERGREIVGLVGIGFFFLGERKRRLACRVE